MTKNYICILAFVCNCLCLAEWPRRTSAEDDIFRALLQRVMDKDEDAAWSEMDKLPLHVLMSEMVRCLSSQAIRDKPEVFEHFRAMVLAKPDWEEWVQSEIDRFRAMKTIRHRISRSYPGAENEPEILLKENQLNQEDYLGLCDIQYFLPMLCTAESVPVMAQYLSFPYTDPVFGGLAFQNETATQLFYLQIPDAPQSQDPEDWKDWWKTNAALYKKGQDGKVHGPAPTRLKLMNGKRPTPLPALPYKPRRLPRAPEKAPTPTSAAQLIPSVTPPLPVAVTAPPQNERQWLLPAAIASGFGALAVLAILFRRRKSSGG